MTMAAAPTFSVEGPPDPELVKFLERWGQEHAYDVRGKMENNQ